MVGNSWFKKNDVYKYTWLKMAEGRVVDKALMDYLCVVTKTNAWKTVRCASVERRRGGSLTIFLVEARLKLLGGWRSAGRMEGVRNVLKVSELNHSVKETAYQESLRVKYEV